MFERARRAARAIAVGAVLASTAVAVGWPAAPAAAAVNPIAYGWGNNAGQAAGNVTPGGYATTPVPVQGYWGFSQVATDGQASAGLLNGQVYTWGSDASYLWGDGLSIIGTGVPDPTAQRYTPGYVKFPRDVNIAQISLGGGHALAVGLDGSLWAWGLDAHGELGIGDTAGYSISPRQVFENGFVAASAGNGFSVALDSSGRVWSWGANSSGQLGNYSTTDSNMPTQASSVPSGITQVSAGSGFALARRGDGSLWAWGANDHGQLGSGTLTGSAIARPVSGVSHITQVTAGTAHALAIDSGGALWTWGANAYGQLGNGGSSDRTTPARVALPAAPVQLAAGGRFSLARLADGRLLGWGGLPTSASPAPTATPTPIPGTSGVADVAAYGDTVLTVMTRQPVTVPNLIGTRYEQAREALDTVYYLHPVPGQISGDCRLAGQITQQFTAAGTTAATGDDLVYKYIDPNQLCTVPNVVGDTLANATAAVAAAGLVVGKKVLVTSCEVLEGEIAATSQFPGDRVPLGSSVDLKQSTGIPAGGCP